MLPPWRRRSPHTRYTLGVLAAIQMLLAILSTTHAFVEVSCLNGSTIHVTARYYGNATAFYVTSDNSSGCHGYQVQTGEWYIEDLLRPECASQLLAGGAGWWTGTVRAQVGQDPSPQDINHTYYCPAAYYSRHKYSSVRSLVHHAGPLTSGAFSLRFVDTRGQDLTEAALGDLVHLKVGYLPPPGEGHSFTVVSCRAGNIFPSPNASYDIIVDGCGDGDVIPTFRGFMTSRVEGVTSLSAVSAAFRAFQIPHYDVIQVQCSFVVCPNDTDCGGDSCQLLKGREKRALSAHDQVYETSSPPIHLALTTDLQYLYEAEPGPPGHQPSPQDRRPPPSRAEDEGLFAAYVAPSVPDDGSGDVDDRAIGNMPRQDNFPYYDYDAGFDGEYYNTGTPMARDGPNSVQAAPSTDSAENVQMMELTVIIVIIIIIVGILLILAITCAFCIVYRISVDNKTLETQPLMIAHSPFRQGHQELFYHEEPELRRGVLDVNPGVDTERGALLDISQISGLFDMESAGEAHLSNVADAEVHGEQRGRVVEMQTQTSLIDETTNEEPSAAGNRDVSGAAGGSPPIVITDDSLISLPNFNPWLIHLESGVDLGLWSPLFSLPRHRASMLTPNLGPLPLCFDSAATGSLYMGQRTCQSTPRSSESTSTITAETAEKAILGDTTLVFSDTSPDKTTTLELADNTIEIEDVQPPCLKSKVLDRPIQWPGIQYPIASTSQNQQHESSLKAFLADGTKCELVSGKAIHHNRLKPEISSHKPEPEPVPGPSQTSDPKLRNLTFSVPHGAHAPIFNLPVIKASDVVQPEDLVSEPDVTLTRRYAFPSPETFPMPTPKRPKPPKPADGSPMDFTVNPLGPPLNARQTRRPPIPECFMQATADQQTEPKQGLDDQATSHDLVEVVDMQEGIIDEPDQDIQGSSVTGSDRPASEATSGEDVPLLVDITDDHPPVSENEATMNIEDTDNLVDDLFSAAFLY